MKTIFTVFGLFGLCLANLEGSKVLRTESLSAQSARLLQDFQGFNENYDFWKPAVAGKRALIMSQLEHLQDLQDFLEAIGVKHEVDVEDVKKFLEDSLLRDAVEAEKRNSADARYAMDWTKYHGHDDINDFIEELAVKHKNFVTVETIGQTYEGREMKIIKIQKAGPGAQNVLIDAGIHAREWISPAVATYLIRELVENSQSHAKYLNNFNFHILPVANPDGYEYSRSSSSNRLWRKNRSDSQNRRTCKGVDLNRNWGFQFGFSGSSSFPCADTYKGESAFSEFETSAMRDYFLSMEPQPSLTISLHSAAELMLYPYGYKRNAFPQNKQELVEVGKRAVQALNGVNGEDFKVMNAADLYPASGASDDWYVSQGVRLVYTPELRDNGYGFVLPANQIIPSGEEFWAAFVVFLEHLL